MIAPREKFQELAKASKWRWQDTVDSAQFQAAVDAAMLQMLLNHSRPPDMATAASFQWRMDGAKTFLQILMGLTEPTSAPPTWPGDNLDHRI